MRRFFITRRLPNRFVACTAVSALNRASAAATQVVMGKVTVRRANAIVFDLADRPLPWSTIRSGETITGRRTVMGVAVSVSRDSLQMRSNAGYLNAVYRRRANVFVSDGVLNAINIRIR
jgi:hypothetical protein